MAATRKKAKKAGRPSRSPRARAALAPVTRPDRLAKASRIRGHVGPENFRPRPSHFRILRAFAEVMDSGGPVNWTAVARAAGVSREYFWQLRRRYPGLEPWLMEHARRAGERMADAVFQKLGVMALRGSVPHAELFYKVLLMTGAAAGRGNAVYEGPAGPEVLQMKIVNIAVPRPGDPPAASASVQTLAASVNE